jgi:hypothetical protein
MCTGACLVVLECAGIHKISGTTVGHKRCADFRVRGRGGGQRIRMEQNKEQGLAWAAIWEWEIRGFSERTVLDQWPIRLRLYGNRLCAHAP